MPCCGNHPIDLCAVKSILKISNMSKKQQINDRYEKGCEELEAKWGMKEGAHVRYVGIEDIDFFLKFRHYCGGPTDPRGRLEIGAIYEIECMLIARSYSKLKLVGFYKEEFNPGMFEPVDRNEKKKYLKPGAHVRYIGETDDMLNFETVYEVESIERNHFGFGFSGLKLVGFDEIFERVLFEKVTNHI